MKNKNYVLGIVLSSVLLVTGLRGAQEYKITNNSSKDVNLQFSTSWLLGSGTDNLVVKSKGTESWRKPGVTLGTDVNTTVLFQAGDDGKWYSADEKKLKVTYTVGYDTPKEVGIIAPYGNLSFQGGDLGKALFHITIEDK